MDMILRSLQFQLIVRSLLDWVMVQIPDFFLNVASAVKANRTPYLTVYNIYTDVLKTEVNATLPFAYPATKLKIPSSLANLLPNKRKRSACRNSRKKNSSRPIWVIPRITRKGNSSLTPLSQTQMMALRKNKVLGSLVAPVISPP